MINSLELKRRLQENETFSDKQAERMAEVLADLSEQELVTTGDLRKELGFWALGIVVGNGTITAALLALYGAV